MEKLHCPMCRAAREGLRSKIRSMDCNHRSSMAKFEDVCLDISRYVDSLLALGLLDVSKFAPTGTVLHIAVRNNCFELAQFLLEHEENYEKVDENRRTALHMCAEISDSKMAALLLEHCESRPRPVLRNDEVFSHADFQELEQIRLLLEHWKKQADELHMEFTRIFTTQRKYHKDLDLSLPLYGGLRQKDPCTCFSFLNSTIDALIGNSLLIDWEKFLIFYQKYQEAQCCCNRNFAAFKTYKLEGEIDRRPMFRQEQLNYQIDHYLGRWTESTIKKICEIKVSENSAILVYIAVLSCYRSPIFDDFKKKLAGAMHQNNGVPAHMKIKDIKTNLAAEICTLLLKLRPRYPINSMMLLDYNCNQSKSLQLTEDVIPYVNRKDCEGYDALLKAVEFNHPHVVRLLLMHGANTCSVTSQGHAALHLAVNLINRGLNFSNSIEMIEVLLTSDKFSVNALTLRAETPLHLAISNCGCKLSGQNSAEFQRRMEIQESIISRLLENKADVNQQDFEGITPIMIASERGCDHIVRLLLNGTFDAVDLNLRDKYGETALIKAARMHHTKIVDALVNSGARVELQDYRGFTALHAALHDPDKFRNLFECFENEFQTIGQSKIEPNGKVNNRVKDSLIGAQDGKKSIKNALINILLGSGLQLETLNFANNTPFDFLVQSEIQFSRCRKEAQQRLDEIRNANSAFKETPCHLDLQWLHIKKRRKSPLYWLAAVCVMIAEHKSMQPTQAEGIKNVKDNKERTVLHYAAILASYGHLADKILVFKALLSMKCDLDAKDIYQRTPLHYLDASSSSLIFGVVDEIQMELTAEQLKFKDMLQRNYIDDETASELSSFGKCNADSEAARTIIRSREAVKAETLSTMLYDNGAMHIHKQNSCDFEKQFPQVIWNESFEQYAYRNALTLNLTTEIDNFMHRLADAIEIKEPWFACQPLLVGSAFEGTKIDLPDEFDFDFILTKFSQLVEVIPSPVAPDGFVHLKRKPNIHANGNEANFFNREGILLTSEINCRFQIVLNQVFQDPSFWENEHLFEMTDAEDTMKKFVQWYHRRINGGDLSDLMDQRLNPSICTTVRLKQTRALDGAYLQNTISMDLVPCIHVDGWWPDKARSDISDALKATGCNLVFDQPQRKYPWVPFGENYARISFAPAESQIIRNSSPTAKAAYMVCKHLIKPQMTYVLKTCLLYCLEANEIENERPLDEKTNYNSVDAKNLSLWVEKLMRCYLMFFLQDFCPCYLMPSFCLPIGDFLKSNHMLLHVTDETNYEFLKKENQSHRCLFREVYTDNFDLFRRVCTSRSTVIPLPKPQPLWEDFSRIDLISALRK